MGRPLKIKKTTTKDIGYVSKDELTNASTSTNLAATQFYGVVGGNDSGGTLATAAYPVLKCRVRIAGFSEADGYILRQKGSTQYLVSDGTNTGVCTLANEADGALSSGNMNITFSFSDSTAQNIARLTNRWALDYSGNRYLVNFFTDEGTEIKSGAANNATVNLGIIENYT